MLPKILQSNLPLSGDCRGRLLNLRARQNLELDNIKSAIALDQASIAEIKEAISGIDEAIKRSKAALAIYNTNIKALKETKTRIMQLSSAHNEGSKPVEGNLPRTYRRAHALISSGASSELKLVEQQEKDLQTQTLNLRSLLSSLEKELHDGNVELVLSKRLLAVHTTSMQGTSSTLNAMQAVLSPVKQVPSEVWEDIFRIVETSLGGNRDPIQSISQVCQDWRAIAMGFTQLWTRVVVPAAPWWPQAEFDMLKKHLLLAGENLITFLVILHEQPKWETQALASEKLGLLYLHREHSFFVSEPESITHRGYLPPASSSAQLILSAVVGSTQANARRRVQKFKSTYQHGYSGTDRRDLIRIPPSFLPQQYSVHFYLGHGAKPVEQRSLSIPFNAPDLVTIEAPNPRAGSFLNVLSSLNRVSRLTLLNIWPNNPSQLTDKLREAKYLRFRTSRMAPFDISPLLSSSLEEFHVEHSCDNTFPQPAETITLPKLHTLAITLHERPLCSMLEFPTLRTLILHSSAPARDLVSTLDFFKSKSHFRRINDLRFYDWDGMDSSSVVIEIVKNIVTASTHLTELTFTNCRLEMPNLISVVTSNVSSLKVINLVCCVGITRADCESLRLNVERLTVSV